MASPVNPAQAAPPEGLWEVDVVKSKVRSKERCSACGEIIASGLMRFKWRPLWDSGAKQLCFHGDCAVRTHEVSRRSVRRSTGLTPDLRAELNKIFDDFPKSIGTSGSVSEPPAEVVEMGLEEAAQAATPETKRMPPIVAEIAETKLHLPLMESPTKKAKLEKDTKGVEPADVNKAMYGCKDVSN